MKRCKRPLSASLALVMLLGLCLAPGLEAVAADGIEMPEFKGVNVVVNYDRNTVTGSMSPAEQEAAEKAKQDELDALDAALEAALKEMGFGTKQIAVLKDQIGIEETEYVAPSGDTNEVTEPEALDLPAADLGKWVVMDHYDSGFYGIPTGNAGNIGLTDDITAFGNGGGAASATRPNANANFNAPKTWIDIFNPGWGGTNFANISVTGKNFNGINGMTNGSLRPYYAYTRAASDTQGNAATPAMKLENWLKGGAYVTNANVDLRTGQPKWSTTAGESNTPTLGSFDRHIFVQEVTDPIDSKKKARMDFVGYQNNSNIDFVFYPMDTDKDMYAHQFKSCEKGDPCRDANDKCTDDDHNVGAPVDLTGADKLVKFDVFGGEVNPHTLYGAGFLINAGVYMNGTTPCISGYVLMYVYPDTGSGPVDSKGKYYPPQLALYKIRNNVSVATFHAAAGGSSASGTTAATSATYNNPAGNPGSGIAVTGSALFTNASGASTGSGAPIAVVPLYTKYTDTATIRNNNITGQSTAVTGKEANWWMDMHINVVIKPDELVVYQVPFHAADATASIVSKAGVKYDDKTLLPTNMLEVMRQPLTATLSSSQTPPNGKSTTTLNGFGPLAAYRTHGCTRATQFTFSNLEMSIIGGVGHEYDVTYNLNGGGGTPPAADKKHFGKPLEISDIGGGVTPPAAGWTFIGWHPEIEGADMTQNNKVMYKAGASYNSNADAVLYAVWKAPQQDKLIDVLTSEQGKFKDGAYNFIIDLTEGDKTDRLGDADGKLTEAATFMKTQYGGISYITDTANAILTDSAGTAMTAPDQGKTVSAQSWLTIAQFIIDSIPPCKDGINYYSDDILVYGVNEGLLKEAALAADSFELSKATEKAVQKMLTLLDPEEGTPKASLSILSLAAADMFCEIDIEIAIKSKGDAGAQATAAALKTAANKARFEINLTQETIFIPGNYTPAAFSLNGGGKWKAFKADKSPFEPFAFPKMLNKEMPSLTITNKWELKDDKDKDTKQLLVKKGAKDPNGDYYGTVVVFPTIKKRPKFDKVAVNYAVYGNDTGRAVGTLYKAEGNWTLVNKTDMQKTPEVLQGLESIWSPGEGPPLPNALHRDRYWRPEAAYPYQRQQTDGNTVLIALPDGTGKFVNTDARYGPVGWGTFCRECGLPVKAFGSQTAEKQAKDTWLVKMAPTEKVDGDTVTYTAPSKTKKIKAVGEMKETKYKIKAKPAKTKTVDVDGTPQVQILKPALKDLKLKKGDILFAGKEADLSKVTNEQYVLYSTAKGIYDTAKAEWDAADEGSRGPAPVLLAPGQVMYIDAAKGAVVSVLNLEGTEVTVWKSATAKKPATKKQKIEIPAP